MKTQIVVPDSDSIAQAAELIRAGEIVAFPTETVYGLGANALDAAAVQKIFLAKGRPSDNPLIVHIASRGQLRELVQSISSDAETLLEAFWPGPLTLVLPKSKAVPDEVTAGGQTVAIRWPSHPIAQQLIQEAGVPIAAPSANLSGKPSPTRAEHVAEDLTERIPLILDGGATEIGLESSVVDVTGEEPILLRAGGISKEELERSLGRPVLVHSDAGETARSPGMKYRHYAPQAKLILFSEDVPLVPETENSALITLDACDSPLFKNHIHFSGSKQKMAHEIFELFRSLDKQGVQVIYVQQIDPSGLGQAIMDRLNRAAER